MATLKRCVSGYLRAGWLPGALVFVALALSLLLPQSSLAAPGAWSPTGSLGAARNGHTATCLAPGRVLAAGGYNPPSGYLASAELYGPASGIWTAIDDMGAARENHTATLLPDGKVRHGATLGFTYRVGTFSVDAAYMALFITKRTIDTNNPELNPAVTDIRGDYQGFSNLFALNLNYLF